MADSESSVHDLKQLVHAFVQERRWKVFHTPKNLATCIMIEGAELCEHFQWLTPEESLALAGKVSSDSPIAEEIADVLSYVLAMANALDIDLEESLRLKMKKNALKYPLPPSA
jgi:NTP pyrophosphatase (non-canonical NTP hydrolase)